MTDRRVLRVRTIPDREVIHTVDVTGKTDAQVERVMMGMLINMRDDCYVEDSADD